MILLLLLLTLADGVLTILLLDLSCEEVNPLMAILIDRGPMEFILGKYLMTAGCLPVLLIFQHHRMFGTRFRVRYLFPVFVSLYLMLLVYQLHLLGVASAAFEDRGALADVATSMVIR